MIFLLLKVALKEKIFREKYLGAPVEDLAKMMKLSKILKGEKEAA